ncbi:uncharacterized protein CcaverHIS019_0404650 [Cutaneotrichosporon cavernicola]|uniref:Mitochondrial carrier n=1 Tax=Cutaneotrichosporon cavernicola TaxID=279322 RepID=A0AA48L484_9TREE|nr:uncharacterized protein CcaverHIS019_0404650 [Cutaneotrichosporon cavernicola]BEI91645.1 hypothetical protein CcaverHIS019_0404650 [Cutaneotrichosporon cavernicola]BEJ07199.1 hypothetical protein CcaverHIS641_0404680 [Cutaneotrichosporon cavernicola]
MAQQQPLTPFGSALAGALGAVFSNALVYPLDTAKTRLQASTSAELAAYEKEDEKAASGPGLKAWIRRRLRKWQLINMLCRIIKREGISGAFKGFSASMINCFSMQFAYFFFHSWLRGTAMKKAEGKGLSTGAELALGAAAGALAQIFTIPVAVVATRQQLWVPPPGATGKARREPTLMETAKSIVASGGITALWTGLKPGLVLTVNPAITYGVFERAKAWILERSGESKLSVSQAFFIGMASKTLATIVTYPYIFAKVRLQAGPEDHHCAEHVHEGESYADAVKGSHRRPTGAIELLKQVYKEDGFAGWYQGMSAQIFKAVLCQGILFVCKDRFEDQARVIMNSVAKLQAKHAGVLSKASA